MILHGSIFLCGFLFAFLSFLLHVRIIMRDKKYGSFLFITILTLVYLFLEIFIRNIGNPETDAYRILSAYRYQVFATILFLSAIPLFLYQMLAASGGWKRFFHGAFLAGTILAIASIMVSLAVPSILIDSSLENMARILAHAEPLPGPLYYAIQVLLIIMIVFLVFSLVFDAFTWKSFEQTKFIPAGALLCLYFELSAIFKALFGFYIDPFTEPPFPRVIAGLALFSLFSAWGLSRVFLLRALHTETARKDLEESKAELSRSLITDELTNLANRHAFILKLDQLIADIGTDPHKRASISLFDITGFSDLNESFGHDTGDAILIGTARLIEALLPENAHLYRMGSDEFAILMEGNGSQVVDLMKRIQDTLAEGLPAGTETIPIHCTMGIAFIPESGLSRKEVLSSAFNVARLAKEDHLGIRLYDVQHYEASLRKIVTATNLRKSLTAGGFRMEYQPITDSFGKIVSVEALVRWDCTDVRCHTSPSEFIPIAESAGLMVELGTLILNLILEDLGSYLARPDFPHLHINLSASQLTSARFYDTVRDKIIAMEIPAAKCIFEVTETVFFERNGSNLEKLRALKDLGCSIAIDDFGSGYSSLGYLKDLPVDTLKLDKAFLDGVPGHKPTEILVEAVASIAKAFNLITVAEGVETREQLEFLASRGYDQYQGWLFHKSMRRDDLLTILGIK